MRFGCKRAWFVALLAAVVFVSAAPTQAACFLRGDVDDDGDRGINDAIVILNYLFRDGVEVSCRDAADVDDDGRLTISDGVYLLQHLFGGARFRRIPFPFSSTGFDPTEDALSCDAHSSGQSPYGLDIPDGVLVFVTDRSGSMQNSGELGIAKSIVGCSIDSLAPLNEFGVVFFDRGILKFPGSGEAAEATGDMKMAAIAWLASVAGGAGSCVMDGLVAALSMANSADAATRTVVYIGDGGGTCRGATEQAYLDNTLAVVDAQNTEGVVIHAVGVLNPRPTNAAFLRELAARNGGEYVER